MDYVVDEKTFTIQNVPIKSYLLQTTYIVYHFSSFLSIPIFSYIFTKVDEIEIEREMVNDKGKKVKVKENQKISIDKKERKRRVKKLLDIISLLYRDIKGRREDLKPLFVIGGVYDIKNPFFENIVDVKNNKLLVDKLCSGIYDCIEKDTISGIVKEQFENDTEVEVKLKEKNIDVLDIPEFFKQLKEKIDNYYTEKVDE